ncbi:biopolymer transporter ExbD [Pedobacter sp. Leaf170]|uniref:ExbD/TolR family protein n=1 Tax=Pedobacter sp. Leaf170 TaxID=2876558 RepID=UPI001E3D159D|nr:biopolymer transporter ExbD [Pedobacter sp. Leaf170]
MATVEISSGGKASGRRNRKTAPRLDLTAMVDLMFLLTTFFMLTTSLSELKAADVAKPIPSEVNEPFPASRTMTILLGKESSTAYYLGETDKASIKEANVAKIGEIITATKKDIARFHGNNPSKFMIVIIKPTKTCSYKDLIDVIDELKIRDVKSYSIDDNHIAEKEQKFLAARGL